MDIDTTPPASHHDGRPSMQLDIPSSDDVMMEVEPDFSLTSAPLNSNVEVNHASSGVLANTMQIRSVAGLSALVHSSASRPGLEVGSPALRSLPVPPVVLISGSDVPAWPKFKLDQLFVEWLARQESRQWLEGLLEDARCGKDPELLVAEQSSRVSRVDRAVSPGPARSSSATPQAPPSASPQQAPGSPVSRLFNNHIPFGDSDSSPLSPPGAPGSGVSPSKPSLSVSIAADFDLGRSGTGSLTGGSPTTLRDILPIPASKASPNQHVSSGLTSNIVYPSGKDGNPGSRDQSHLHSGSRASAARSEGNAGLEQVPDSKVLDRVADGIAGMSAAVDGVTGSTSAMKVDQSATGDVIQQGRHRPSHGARGAVESAGKRDSTAPFVLHSAIGQKTSSTGAEEPYHSRIALGSVGLATGNVVLVNDIAEGRKEELSRSSPIGEGSEVQMPVLKQQALKGSADSMITDSGTEASTEGGSVRLAGAMLPPRVKMSVGHNSEMQGRAAKPKIRTTLPRFYFPCGKDADSRERREREGIKEFFKVQRVQKNVEGVNRTDIAELVVEVIGLPSYFATLVFSAIQDLCPLPSTETARAVGEGLGRATASGSSDRRDRESTMRDVAHAGDASHGSADTRRATSAEIAGPTISDATMGEIASTPTEEKRANGYRAMSHQSSEVANQVVGVRDIPPSHGSAGSELVTEDQFLAYYNAFCAGSSKEGRLFSALRDPQSNRTYLIPGDFKPLMHALLRCHQGLVFLHATPEFQQRYSETVIERIYFGCTRQHNGRLMLNDIRRSKLLDTLMLVDEEDDINRERKYFSYEHFYVLYCRFWELDANHDLQIDREDLMRYGSHSLTYRIVDRIFGGYARPLDCPENPGFMSYTDFIWFCLSEEDKTSDTAIDYWFRCVDMDGDGLITMYDMEFFYKEQLHRMECFGHEPVQIRDILCQLLDMIKPNMQPPVIRRRDLKRCRLAGNFFNVLFNLNKFFAIEARDPLQIRQEHATPELTDWDRFAAIEYLRLSSEEEGEEDESWEDVSDAANPLMAGEAPF